MEGSVGIEAAWTWQQVPTKVSTSLAEAQAAFRHLYNPSEAESFETRVLIPCAGQATLTGHIGSPEVAL